MAISKKQPMRPALNDCVDSLNNLNIEGMESSINALSSRIDSLEHSPHLRCLKGSVEEQAQPTKHTFIEIELPQNVNYETDVIACIPSGGQFTNNVPDGETTQIPMCYTRYVNYYYDESNHKVVFHWYPSSTVGAPNNNYRFEGIVIYIERSA